METVTRSLRGWRRFAALTAIAAIIFHAALLLLHQPVQAAEGDARDGSSIVLCTAFGLKVVALADLSDPPPVQGDSQKSSVYYCPICLGAQLSAIAVVPETFQLSKPDLAFAEVARPISERVVVPIFAGTLGSRGPPSIV